MHFALPFLLLILGSCRANGPLPATATSSGKPFAQRLKGPENFARIDERLYRGAQPDAAGFRELQSLGIKTVVSLRAPHTDDGEAKSAGLDLVQIPMQVGLFGSEAPTDEQIRTFFTTVLDPARQPVYVHCAQGKDRTGTFAALWRIEVDGWTPAEAIEEMQSFGYHGYFDDLIEFVRNYRPRGFVPWQR